MGRRGRRFDGGHVDVGSRGSRQRRRGRLDIADRLPGARYGSLCVRETGDQQRGGDAPGPSSSCIQRSVRGRCIMRALHWPRGARDRYMDDLWHPHATVDSNNPPRIKIWTFLGLLAGPYRSRGCYERVSRMGIERVRGADFTRLFLSDFSVRVRQCRFFSCRHAVKIA
ncbi:hypothetical protein BCEN4_760014 [Burkholderia cenocepacia]|nr:hypothetical protein BCEN4_760014 [Burkholderia cenocepacia]